MIRTPQYIILYLLLLMVFHFQCLKIIPERVALTFLDNNIIDEDVQLNVRRYNRRGDYVINLICTIKKTLDETVMVDILFYQYLNNQYKRSFPEFHENVCELITKDPYIGKVFRESGLVACPVLPGKYSLTNITTAAIEVPSVWPFEKGMIEFIFQNSTSKAFIAKAELSLTFKEELQKKNH